MSATIKNEIPPKNVGILRCKEKDLRWNLEWLSANYAKLIPGVPSIIGKGRYFYLMLGNIDEVKHLPLKGRWI